MKPNLTHWLGLWIVLGALSGCALTSRSEPMQVRYFSADDPLGAAPRSASSSAQGIELRLARVDASSHLGEAIAYRGDERVVGYYDDQRWTERPAAFLERGLERALFQQYGLRRVVGGASETLSVELTAFEEVRGQRPVALVEATIVLHDERSSHLEQTLRVERPIPNTGKDSVTRAVSALAAALDEAVAQIARTVSARLSALAAAEGAPAEPAAAASAR